MIKMRYCKKCVYPFVAANLDIPDDGVCSSCETFDSYESITKKEWIDRRKKLEELIRSSLSKNNSNYDCIIPVSGGKDSTRQALFVRDKLKMKPLLVSLTHPPQTVSDLGANNLSNLISHGFDVIVSGPSPNTWKKLMKKGFLKYSNFQLYSFLHQE